MQATNYVKRPYTDTTVGIWDVFYKVRMRELDSRSYEDIKEFGTIVSGYDEIDNTIATRTSVFWVNIDRMAEYKKSNIVFSIVDEKDTVAIYNAISEHIDAWLYTITNMINLGEPPYDDLVLLDELANEVYEGAKWIITEEFLSTEAGKGFTNVMPLNMNNIFKPRVKRGRSVLGFKDNHVEQKVEERSEHVSLRDRLATGISTWE